VPAGGVAPNRGVKRGSGEKSKGCWGAEASNGAIGVETEARVHRKGKIIPPRVGN